MVISLTHKVNYFCQLYHDRLPQRKRTKEYLGRPLKIFQMQRRSAKENQGKQAEGGADTAQGQNDAMLVRKKGSPSRAAL
jgi:hypothetical protein